MPPTSCLKLQPLRLYSGLTMGKDLNEESSAEPTADQRVDPGGPESQRLRRLALKGMVRLLSALFGPSLLCLVILDLLKIPASKGHETRPIWVDVVIVLVLGTTNMIVTGKLISRVSSDVKRQFPPDEDERQNLTT